MLSIVPSYAEVSEVINGGANATEAASGAYTYPLYGYWGGNLTQLIYTAEQLTEAGLTPGSMISELTFFHKVERVKTYRHFRIRMGNTAVSSFGTTTSGVTGFISDNMETVSGDDTNESVFNSGPLTPAGEWRELTFQVTPFFWDGRNLVIEIGWTNNNGGDGNGNYIVLRAWNTPNGSPQKGIVRRHDNKPSLAEFTATGEKTRTCPFIRFTYSNSSEPVLFVKPNRISSRFLYVNSYTEPNEIKIKTMNIAAGKQIVITPAENAYVSLTNDNANWITHPSSLTITKENGVEEYTIFAKLKSGEQEEEYRSSVKIACDAVERIVNLDANGNLLKTYCASGAIYQSDQDIGKIVIKDGDIELYSNGDDKPLYNNKTANKLYTDYTGLEPIHLRAGEFYDMTVSIVNLDTTAYTCAVKGYIDINKDFAFSEDELLYFVPKTGSGSELNEDSHTGKFIIPPKVNFGLGDIFLLRLVVDEDDVAPACGNYSWGETEDYYVKLDPPAPKYFKQVTCDQIGPEFVGIGAENIEMLKTDVMVAGGTGSLKLTKMVFNTDGSYEVEGIKNAKLYYTKSEQSLNDEAVQVGNTLVKPNGDMEFVPAEPIEVAAGENYFFLTYDIENTASSETILDGKLTGLYFENDPENKVKKEISPKGVTSVYEGTLYTGFEGFEEFMKGSGWTSKADGNAVRYWRAVNRTTAPVIMPYNGNMFAQFNAFSAPNGHIERLISPVFKLFNQNAKGELSFWMYRHDYKTDKNGSTLEVLITDKVDIDNIDKDAKHLIPIGNAKKVMNNLTTKEPEEAETGWYKYSYKIPDEYKGRKNRLYFKAKGDYWNRLAIDEVIIGNKPNMYVYGIDTLAKDSDYLPIGGEDKKITGLSLDIRGEEDSIVVKKVKFDLPNTTNVADIAKAKVWRMPFGNEDGPFNVKKATLLGTLTNLKAKDNVVILENGAMKRGENKLYVTIDIKDNATDENKVDFEFKTITIGRKTGDFAREMPVKDGNNKGVHTIKGALEGEYIVGGTKEGDKYFEDIYDALVAIELLGAKGDVTFAINKDIEVKADKPLVFKDYEKKGGNHSLTLYPKGEKRAIYGKYQAPTLKDATGIITVEGLDNFIIDGRVNRNENYKGKGFKISAYGVSDTKYSTAIMINTVSPNTEDQNPVNNVEILNSEITCYINKGNSFGIRLAGKDNVRFKLKNSHIYNANTGFAVDIVTTWDKSVENVEIINNEFGNNEIDSTLGSKAMYLSTVEGLKIIGNKIHNITSRAFPVEAIAISSKSNNIDIEHNEIFNIYGANNNTSTAISIHGKDNDNTNKNINIYNNVIDNVLSDTRESQKWSGGIFTSYCEDMKIFHNSVNIAGDKQTIPNVSVNLVLNGSTACLNSTNNKRINVKNNIFVNSIINKVNENNANVITTNNYIYYYEGEENPDYDHNVLSYDNTNKYRLAFTRNQNNQGVAYVSLNDYQKASGKDANSVQIPITFEEGKPIGTLSAKSALNSKISAPAIAGLEDLKDIHGNTRPTTYEVTIGADQVSTDVNITNFTKEVTNICAPGKGEINVSAAVGKFDDGVDRNMVDVEPEYTYLWFKNDKPIENKQIVQEDANGDGELEEVLKAVNSNKFEPFVEKDNLLNPDYYSVIVKVAGKTAESEKCKVTAEEAINITKEPAAQSQLCADSEASEIEVEATGTITGYQWQKEVDGLWEDLDGETNKKLSVKLNDPKYGAGRYRVHIKGGKLRCNNKEVYSNIITLNVVQPIRNAVLVTNPPASENGVIRMCEGKPVSVKLDVDKLKGDVFGYTWQEYVDGNWVDCDLEKRDYLTDIGFESKAGRPTYSGTFRLVVKGSETCKEANAITNTVTLMIDPYARIIRDAQPQVVCKGELVTLSVEVEGENTSYQWYKDGKPVSLSENKTAHKPIFMINKASFEDAGSYQVIIDIDGCVENGEFGKLKSSPVTVFVMNEPQIIQEPENSNAIEGKSARFEVIATAVGAPPHYVPEYQWYKGTTKLKNGPKYSGVNANILLVNDIKKADEGGAPYYVVIKGMCGRDSLVSEKVKINVTDFAFTKFLENETVCEGNEVKLSVEAETKYPNAEISYEWHYINRNGRDIKLQNKGNELTFAPTAENEGKYYVIASIKGVENSIKSNYSNVKVNVKPVITKELGITNAKPNEMFSLTVKANGNDLEYKWYRDGEEIEGAVSATLTHNETEIGSHTYKVEVSNDCGMAESETTVNIGQNMAEVVEEVNYGFSVSNIMPNPVVSNEAKFSVNTNEASFAEISITDARGKSTKFFSGNIDGVKEFSLNTNGYVNGTYYLVININGKTITRSFVVVK